MYPLTVPLPPDLIDRLAALHPDAEEDDDAPQKHVLAAAVLAGLAVDRLGRVER